MFFLGPFSKTTAGVGLANILLASLYFAGARLGLQLAFVNESITAVWPPTGLAIASLLLFGYRMWPGIFLGAFFANLATAGTVFTSLGIAGGNTLEALLGAYLVSRFAHGREAFSHPNDIFKFAFLGGGVAPVVGATVGVSTLILGGVLEWTGYGAAWITWWLGDMGGAIIFTPLMVLWCTQPSSYKNWRWDRWVELVLAFALLIFSGAIIFNNFLDIGIRNYPIAFLIAPSLLWITVRFSQKESALAVLVLTIMAIFGTLKGYGPFRFNGSLNTSLLILQSFMIVSAIISQVLTASIARYRSTVQELEKVNKIKNEFLAVLAHELRNPLAPMLSHLEIIKFQKTDNPDIEEATVVVEEQLKTMTRLLDDLLDTSRVIHGKINFKKEKIDVRTAVQMAIKSSRAFIESRQHVLSVDMPPSPIWIIADPVRIEQVIVNILNNAAKYTELGGQIKVACAVEGNNAIIRIRDSGIGIPPDALSRIFDMFAQVDYSLARTHGGLGIGLHLAKSLIQLQGGTIRAESGGLGRGSEFIISIPGAR